MRWSACLIALSALLAAAAPAAAAPKTATIDIVRAMQAHPRTKVVEEKLRQARLDADNDLRTQEQLLKDMKQRLDQMTENDPERMLKMKQYELQYNAAKFNYEWSLRVAAQEYTRSLEQLYRAVQAVAARYALEQSIELVLHTTPAGTEFNAGSAEDFGIKARLRVVIYAAPETDITDKVIERLG